MTEKDSFDSFDLNKELVSLKKEETMLVKELQRVVDSFNQALLVKEKIRISLMGKIVNLEKMRNEQFESLKKVIRNIEIYDNNLEQIVEKKSMISEKETRIKTRYEEILHGSSSTPLVALASEEGEIFNDVCQDLLGIHQDLQKINKMANKEELMKCREEYLRGLQKLFQKLDEELVEIDRQKGKIKKFHFEIKRKKDKAKKQQNSLKGNYNVLVEDVKKKKVDLEISLQEERSLIVEYRQLINNIQSSTKISEETEGLMDKLLSSPDSMNSLDEENA